MYVLKSDDIDEDFFFFFWFQHTRRRAGVDQALIAALERLACNVRVS